MKFYLASIKWVLESIFIILANWFLFWKLYNFNIMAKSLSTKILTVISLVANMFKCESRRPSFFDKLRCWYKYVPVKCYWSLRFLEPSYLCLFWVYNLKTHLEYCLFLLIFFFVGITLKIVCPFLCNVHKHPCQHEWNSFLGKDFLAWFNYWLVI